MLSNKLDGPRRGRSFDSINKSYEEKQLNNEVRTTFDIIQNAQFFANILHIKMLTFFNIGRKVCCQNG